ncbi:MAG: hypothetical protein JWR75_810 [Devosia sp.]|nr:hypothetical protein [Devosia sp.]
MRDFGNRQAGLVDPQFECPAIEAHPVQRPDDGARYSGGFSVSSGTPFSTKALRNTDPSACKASTNKPAQYSGLTAPGWSKRQARRIIQ